MVFSCKPYEVQHRVIDTSLLASRYSFLPQSLGLRTQALKLRFVSPDIKGHFLKQHIRMQDIFARIGGGPPGPATAAVRKGSIFLRAFIGETVSLVFAPYFCKNNALYDAVSERPLKRLTCERVEETFEFDRSEKWKVKLIPTLCPHCGWDLKGEKQSCVLFCPNCDSAWEAFGTGFKAVDYGIITAPAGQILYVPFWRMKADIEGTPLQSYADMIKFTNLPKAIQMEWNEKELFFWSPAFKIQPKLFLRLAQQVTVFQPEEKFERGLDGRSVFPVTLPAVEAEEGIAVTLAQVAADKKKVFPKLADIRISMREHRLILLPFFVRANELVQCQMKFSINRNALQMGKKI
jgi:predicted Zn-ribbon and HTH transcriptional regulator